MLLKLIKIILMLTGVVTFIGIGQAAWARWTQNEQDIKKIKDVLNWMIGQEK